VWVSGVWGCAHVPLVSCGLVGWAHARALCRVCVVCARRDPAPRGVGVPPAAARDRARAARREPYVKNKAGLTGQTFPGRRIPGHWPYPAPEELAETEPVTLD